jgi:hypothetical protein
MLINQAERLARVKHSSLLGILVNYSRKKLNNMDTRTQCYKTFYCRNLRVFVDGKLFRSSLVFLVGPELTPMKSLSGYTLWGRLLSLPTNIRLVWKGLPRKNTLAYSENW